MKKEEAKQTDSTSTFGTKIDCHNEYKSNSRYVNNTNDQLFQTKYTLLIILFQNVGKHIRYNIEKITEQMRNDYYTYLIIIKHDKIFCKAACRHPGFGYETWHNLNSLHTSPALCKAHLENDCPHTPTIHATNLVLGALSRDISLQSLASSAEQSSVAPLQAGTQQVNGASPPSETKFQTLTIVYKPVHIQMVSTIDHYPLTGNGSTIRATHRVPHTNTTIDSSSPPLT